MNGWVCELCGASNSPLLLQCPCRIASATDSANSANGIASHSADSATDSATDSASAVAGKTLDLGSGSEPRTSTKNRSRFNYEDPDFLAFWMTYPRKKEKAAAFAAYRKAIAAGIAPQTILAAAGRYAIEVADVEERFRKYPAGWLNDGRWDDEDGAPVVNNDARYQPFDLEEHLSSLAEIPSEPEERGDALATALPDVTNVGVGDQGSDAGDGLAEDARAQTSPPTPTTSEPEHLDESEIPGEVRALVDGIGS